MKFNLVVLTIALSLSLVACGGDSKKQPKKADAPAQTEAGQKVVAGPNGELRVVDMASRTRKVKEVVVGADGKLEVVEKDAPACCAPKRSSRRCCR